MTFPPIYKGFPGSSVGKESACIAGDLSLISGSGRHCEEGIGYPLRYSWTSLLVEMMKNLPAMRENWVWSLGWEDSLEEGMQPTPVFLPGDYQGQRSLVDHSPRGCSDGHNWVTKHTGIKWLIRLLQNWNTLIAAMTTVSLWNSLIDISCIASPVNWIIFPQNLYVDSLIYNVIVWRRDLWR